MKGQGLDWPYISMIKALLSAFVVFTFAVQSVGAAEPAPGPIIGIGTEIKSEAGHPVVANVLPDSPADKAGVKAKDRLTKIDHKSVDGLTLLEVAHRLRGNENSKVHLTVDRGGRTKDFDLKREILFLPGTRPASMP